MAAPLLAQVKCFEGEAANSMLDRPDASRYVFAHVLDDCGQVRGPHATQRALQRTHPSMISTSVMSCQACCGPLSCTGHMWCA